MIKPVVAEQPKKEVESKIVKEIVQPKKDAVEVSSISDTDSEQANKEALRAIIKKDKLAKMLAAKSTGIEKEPKKKMGRAQKDRLNLKNKLRKEMR